MKKALLCIAVLFSALAAQAKVELPQIFGDNMVLQRNTQAKIWGKAEPDKKVTITTSWNKEKITVMADEAGKWMASVNTGEAGGPYSVVISDGEKLTLNNVLLGEVWFCSGQSNMEMPMKGFTAQPTADATDLIIQAKASTPIRICNVVRNSCFELQEDTKMKWEENIPSVVANTSAIAYFFAQYVQEYVGIPVGIIVSSWGGSSIETWMDKETIQEDFPELSLAHLETKDNQDKPHQLSCLLYNGMVAPIIPYTIKGMIWYQGCTNRHRHAQYERLQTAMVASFREKWGVGEFPFYFVQLAPHDYGKEGPNHTRTAIMREAQANTLKTIPNSGMAVSLDAGDRFCIHPAKKKELGHRLAYMALADNYGLEGIDVRAPMYKSMRVEDGQAIITFDAGKLGIAPLGHKLEGFEVAGADKVFHKAYGYVDKDRTSVRLTCPEVAEPVAVRYAFKNSPEVISLYNNFGIPAAPFRTDNW